MVKAYSFYRIQHKVIISIPIFDIKIPEDVHSSIELDFELSLLALEVVLAHIIGHYNGDGCHQQNDHE